MFYPSTWKGNKTSDVCLSPSYSGGGGRKSPQTHEFKANGKNVMGRGEGQKDTERASIGERKTQTMERLRQQGSVSSAVTGQQEPHSSQYIFIIFCFVLRQG